MFGLRRRGTIIGEGLKVVGNVTANDRVRLYGQIDGDLRCASLVLARKAQLRGTITADSVVIDGKVEGPIQAATVVLKPRAHVVGDIRHQSLDVRKGAFFEGRSLHAQDSGEGHEALSKKPTRRSSGGNLEVVPSDPAA